MKFNTIILIVSIFTHGAAADCWEFASQRFGLEVRLLKSIAEVESGMNPSALGENKNGTHDYGLMQINSSHLKWLNKNRIDESMLINDPCISVLVGASILKNMVNVYGYSWEAVGAYNTGPGRGKHTLRMKYIRKVWGVYKQGTYDKLPLALSEHHRKLTLQH